MPGIATGSIIALSRALGEAAPLLLLGALVFVSFDPNGLLSGFTTLPIQIFNWTGRPQEGFHELAAAASIILLGLLLLMNGLAIYIRNRYQQTVVSPVTSSDEAASRTPAPRTARHGRPGRDPTDHAACENVDVYYGDFRAVTEVNLEFGLA